MERSTLTCKWTLRNAALLLGYSRQRLSSYAQPKVCENRRDIILARLVSLTELFLNRPLDLNFMSHESVCPSISLFSSHLRLLVSQCTPAAITNMHPHKDSRFFVHLRNYRSNISNTRASVSSRRESWNYDAQRNNFDEIRIWIADETLSRVFDIPTQSKQKLRSKRWSKIVKIYDN